MITTVEKPPRPVRMFRMLMAFLLLAVTSYAQAASAQAQDYDLVILNGRVMDPESGLDAVRNVGVKDGAITAITNSSIKGKETIDASGLVVGHPRQVIPFCSFVKRRHNVQHLAHISCALRSL